MASTTLLRCVCHSSCKSVDTDMLQRLITWDTGAYTDPHSIKGSIAEMTACLGKAVSESTIAVFGADDY